MEETDFEENNLQAQFEETLYIHNTYRSKYVR